MMMMRGRNALAGAWQACAPVTHDGHMDTLQAHVLIQMKNSCHDLYGLKMKIHVMIYMGQR